MEQSVLSFRKKFFLGSCPWSSLTLYYCFVRQEPGRHGQSPGRQAIPRQHMSPTVLSYEQHSTSACPMECSLEYTLQHHTVQKKLFSKEEAMGKNRLINHNFCWKFYGHWKLQNAFTPEKGYILELMVIFKVPECLLSTQGK